MSVNRSELPWVRKLFKYAINGFVNTAITYGLYLLLIQVIDYRIAIVSCYCVGMVISYYLNRLTVFRSPGHFGRFVVLYLSMLMLNMSVTAGLVEILGWSAALAQVPAIALVFAVGYIINGLWVFRPLRRRL